MPVAFIPATHGFCDSCNMPTPWHLLDAKPFAFATPDQVRAALESNADFERLECQRCYGPGWVANGA